MDLNLNFVEIAMMIISEHFSEYKILDTGDGMKLEKWGEVLLSRPDPQVIWDKQKPELWSSADAVYLRSNKGGGAWKYNNTVPEKWTISYGPLSFYLRLTGFKHTGLFPEQAANWDFMIKKIKQAGREIKVLNLFAYTGGATVACASAGAKVTHIDAAKSMNGWAKENLALSGLDNAPVRIIADDCLKFVLREQRRGSAYDAIIMDPPSYGRGAGGSVFRAEDNVFELATEAAKLLTDDPLFFVINSYTTGFSSVVTENILKICLGVKSGNYEAADLVLPVENQQIYLPCGTTARWQK